MRDELTRRRFLEVTGIAGASVLLPGWLAQAAATAVPVGPNDGILVHLTLDGGNDGLNTFVPIADAAYHEARRHLAIRPEQAIHLSPSRGLHPELSYLKSLWDRGSVAVIDGVGQPVDDLSHFVAMDAMMTADRTGLPGDSGWLGRVLDGLARHPLNGLSIGSRVPLLLDGRTTRGSAVPVDAGSVRSINREDGRARHRLDAMVDLGRRSSGLGSLADEATAVLAESIELATDLRPHLPAASTEEGLVKRLRLAADLINANVGVRVLSIVWGDFDTHANQLERHGTLLRELDDGLRAFFTTLNPAIAGKVVVLGTSEFGRRVRANANGSDHGTANSFFAIGAPVKGGFYGEMPSLSSLDRRGNLHHRVDYRQVYANVATVLLGADASEIVGANYPDLGFLTPPGGSSNDPISLPATPSSRRAIQGQLIRLYLAYFGRPPEDSGLEYWTSVRESGRSLNQIADEFASSLEFRTRYGSLSDGQFVELAYRQVLERAGDASGVSHWNSVLASGGFRGQVMVGLAESSEFKRRTAATIAHVESTGPIGRLYRAYFLRQPDLVGLDYWINSRLDRAQVSEQFSASAEFRNRYGRLGDEQFVAMAYRNVLEREPDAEGLSHWVGVLRRGVPRGQVMLGFSDSSEFVRKVRGAS